MNIVRNYFQDETGLSETVQTMLLLVIGIFAALAVGRMIYQGISMGKAAMGQDFIQGG